MPHAIARVLFLVTIVGGTIVGLVTRRRRGWLRAFRLGGCHRWIIITFLVHDF